MKSRAGKKMRRGKILSAVFEGSDISALAILIIGCIMYVLGHNVVGFV